MLRLGALVLVAALAANAPTLSPVPSSGAPQEQVNANTGHQVAASGPAKPAPEVREAIATEVIADYTRKLAGLTGVLAVVGIVTSGLSLWQILLARAEFNATHRPKIIVRAFQITSDPILKDDEAPAWIFTGQNIGTSPANVIEVRSGTIVLKDGEKIPTDISFGFKEATPVKLVSGDKELFPGNGGTALIGNQAMEIFAGYRVLLCMGVIIYTDNSGLQRETGFCRRYRPREREWDTLSDSEYEYAY